MSTYCDYCMLTGHTRYNCPALAGRLCPSCGLEAGSTAYTGNRTSLKIRCSTCHSLKLPKEDKENYKLALQEADDASTEELEAAGEIWDQRVALSEKQGAADARRESMENR